MYPHRWPTLILVLIVATIALSSIAYGDTGRGPFLQLGSTNISGNPLTPTTLVGSGGYGLRHLLHSDSLRQTATDQQGIENFSSNTTAYALTNYPLSEIQLAKAGRRLVQVPIVFSPLVVIYNIAGIEDGELRLDGACLNGIYTCDIRYWSDPQIVALNPSLAQRLPRELIRLFAHDDSDSTTRLFRQYVWETSAWSSECVLMRVSDFESAPDIAQNVYDGNYSIGYTEFASALSILRTSKSVTDPSGMAARKNMVRSFGIAAIKNKNGSFVAPSKEMVYPFQAAALPDSIKSPKWGLVNVSASGELGAYPMGGLVYIITDANLGLLGGSVAAAMKEFLLSSLSEQFQANVSEYGGVPLPQSQVMLEKQQIESLSTTPPSPVQPGDTALPLPTLIGAVVGSTLAAAVLIGGSALCYVRYRRRLQVRQVTESIRAWRAELAKEGLLVQHEDIHYECVPGSNTKHVVLGQGSFGKVYKANWNGTTVAVKVLKNKSDSQRAAFVREANMLQSLRYPNIVHYLGCAINDHNEMMLVMECMGGGDLSKAMSKERGGQRRFSWHVNGRYILLGIARGMAYMHSKGVIIFDVKAANVLLDETGMTAKIADVGEAKAMAGSSTETLARGTKVYMAPELFYSSNSSGDGTYKVAVTQAVDVYSFGVLMWEVLTGERPQYASESLRKPRVPEECPLSMDALWKRCIARAPHQRPTANEILAEISAAVIPVR